MATDLGPSRSAKAGKHDAFVQTQLHRAEQRIRLLDVGAALLGFVALLCGCLALLALADHAWTLPAWLRQVSLAALALGGGAYLYRTLARPLLYRVNPYYAAQRVEQTLPGAKNSVVNWVDLHERQLPPAIRGAVAQKAAKDLAKADVEAAVGGRRLTLVGAAAGVGAGLLLVCVFKTGGEALFRVALPFSFGTPVVRTAVSIVKPTGGDETVTLNHAVFVTVRVEGKLPDPKGPDAVRVLVRYQPDDPYLPALRMRPDGDEFTATISAQDVRDGFWYKVVAGDVETAEYRVSVRATPLLSSVQATYHFRPYVARADEQHYARRPFKLEALRGTEVTLRAATNRPVKDAYFVFEGKDGPERLAAEKVADEVQAFQVKFVVDKSARYRLEYTTADNEAYSDPTFWQELVAVPDRAPEPVELTLPGRDTPLPCNGILQVEGAAVDDVGVKLTLHVQVTKGPRLRAKPYRGDKGWQLADGGYPKRLEYKDFIDLKTVQSADGKPVALAAGMELEYWLAAADACDYPRPNVSESKHYRVQLLDPLADPEQLKDQREQAAQQQQQHEANQSDALKKEEQARRQEEEFRKEQARHEQEETKPQPGKPQGEKKADDKHGNGGQQDDPKANKSPAETKPNDAAKPNEARSPEQKQQDEKTAQQANELKKKLDEQRQAQQRQDKQDQQGQAKPDRGDQGQPSAGKELGARPEPKNAPSETKPQGQPDAKQPPAAPKDPPKADAKQEAAQKKEEGQTSNQVCPRGDCKNGGMSQNSPKSVPKDQLSPAANKSEGKNDGGEKPGGQPKGEPKAGGNPSSAEGKPQPQQTNGDHPAKAEPKQDKVSGGGGSTAKSDPQDAKPDDVTKAANGLKSAAHQERKDAARQLQKIADKAKDEKTRAQARKALEQAGQKPTPESEPEAPPNDKEGSGEGNTVCAAKGDHGSKQTATGTAKGGEKGKEDVPPAEEKFLPEPTPTDGKDQTPTPADAADKEALRQQRAEYLKKVEEGLKKQGKFDERKWQEALKRDGDKITPPDLGGGKERPEFVPEEKLLDGDDGGPPVIKDNTPREDRATQLQLRAFRDAVDKKTLDQAGITPEQWRAFLKRYADLAQRQDPTAAETLPAPKNGGRLGSHGGQRTNPGATANPDDARGSSRSQPPPAYRDAWRRFTQDLSKPDDKK